LNDTHQPLFYADDVNTLGGREYILKKNTEALVVPRRKNRLEVIVIKLSTWLCLEIRIQDEDTIKVLITVPLRRWNISNILEQP
jgi:hypothetical protein